MFFNLKIYFDKSKIIYLGLKKPAINQSVLYQQKHRKVDFYLNGCWFCLGIIHFSIGYRRMLSADRGMQLEN